MPSRTRRLWQIFTTALLISLIGAAILFTPTLEFAAVDIIDKLHLPIGPVANFALYAELALFLTSLLGLLTLTIRTFIRRR